jgi:acid phosphatase (class A)
MSQDHGRTRFVTVLIFTLFAGVRALAADQTCPNLDPLPLALVLMPPPSENSQETMAELRELQDLEILRSEEQVERARADYEKSIKRFLGDIHIRVDDRPTIAIHFFDCVGKLVEKEVNEAKRKFNRTRPYKFPNNDLHILKAEKERDSPSYPSGHAAYGMVAGLLLAQMIPEKSKEILQRIETFGYSRLLSGVHFRSDVYAGQIAGAAIVAHLFTSNELRFLFENAKADLRKALGY